jgi:arginase family enzyme
MDGHYLETISDFLMPISKSVISDDDGYQPHQIGYHINCFEQSFPDLLRADIVLFSCGDTRGAGADKHNEDYALQIRKEFYALYFWHKELLIADIGEVKKGATPADTAAAIRTITTELIKLNKKSIMIGGCHDLMLAQYDAFGCLNKTIEATNIDAYININKESRFPAEHFLLDMFTSEPNFLRHYNHIGFQSYFVHPGMLETIDKLRFDCFRLGRVKENIGEMEPVIRHSHLISLDISAIQHSHAPCNTSSPNGFNGEEVCRLIRYAGMSDIMLAGGIFGYHATTDHYNLTAKQISQILWYFLDGVFKGRQEASFADLKAFREFKLAFAEIETTFWQSTFTDRWWMELPDGNKMACSQLDYITAKNNEIPERWMRAVERLS